MRKYALGCALLDLDDPSKVIARSREPILTAENADRSGYVPNVVYTCGALRTGNHLLIPYGISDSAIGFATAAHRRPAQHDEVRRLGAPVSGGHGLPGQRDGADHPGVVSERRALDQRFDICVGEF